MHRILWFTVGGRRLHLLKLAGAFLLFGAVLKVAQSAYEIFVVVDKIAYASLNPNAVGQLFGWTIGSGVISSEDVLGLLLGPIATFLFWLALLVFGLMIYQSGRVVFPVEEYEQRVSEHHRALIRHAVAKHKKRKR